MCLYASVHSGRCGHVEFLWLECDALSVTRCRQREAPLYCTRLECLGCWERKWDKRLGKLPAFCPPPEETVVARERERATIEFVRGCMGLDARAQWNARRALDEAARFYVEKLEDFRRERAREVGGEDTSLWRRQDGYQVWRHVERGDFGRGLWDGLMVRGVGGDRVYVRVEGGDEVHEGEEDGGSDWSSGWAGTLRASLGLD